MYPSPSEQYLSAPADGSCPSLFESTNMMTPGSSCDDTMSSPAPEPSEKKTAKKRKSWGQVLPEPKTNLPPRKRAKTEDEKEQRRVERVLRNRRAAQSSRERKRQEVEALEQRNQILEKAIADAQKANEALIDEIRRLRGDNPGAAPLSLESFKNSTLSPHLFGVEQDKDVSELVKPEQHTVNPASLSPQPSADFVDETVFKSEEVSTPTFEDLDAQPCASTPDVTQHPAAMLCDLQCHISEETRTVLTSSQTWSAIFLSLHLMTTSSLSTLAACQLPTNQVLLSLKANLPLHPSPHILTTIISLVTRPRISSSNQRMASTSHPSTTTTATLSTRLTRSRTSSHSSRKPATLRIKSLRKILSCSPSLARPLQDATLEAMRLVSSRHDSQVAGLQSAKSSLTYDLHNQELRECLRGVALPSYEALMSLLWALKVEEKKFEVEPMKTRQNVHSRHIHDKYSAQYGQCGRLDVFAATGV